MGEVERFGVALVRGTRDARQTKFLTKKLTKDWQPEEAVCSLRAKMLAGTPVPHRSAWGQVSAPGSSFLLMSTPGGCSDGSD